MIRSMDKRAEESTSTINSALDSLCVCLTNAQRIESKLGPNKYPMFSKCSSIQNGSWNVLRCFTTTPVTVLIENDGIKCCFLYLLFRKIVSPHISVSLCLPSMVPHVDSPIVDMANEFATHNLTLRLVTHSCG